MATSGEISTKPLLSFLVNHLIFLLIEVASLTTLPLALVFNSVPKKSRFAVSLSALN